MSELRMVPLWERRVAGSNPVTPTQKSQVRGAFLIIQADSIPYGVAKPVAEGPFFEAAPAGADVRADTNPNPLSLLPCDFGHIIALSDGSHLRVTR